MSLHITHETISPAWGIIVFQLHPILISVTTACPIPSPLPKHHRVAVQSAFASYDFLIKMSRHLLLQALLRPPHKSFRGGEDRKTRFGCGALHFSLFHLDLFRRDRTYRSTYGTRATRLTAAKATKEGFPGCRRNRPTEPPHSIWRTSRSRTKDGE